MRIAFVHDWLVVSGGAEKVTREILRAFDADVFALIDFLNEDDRKTILHGKHARTSFIQHLPFAKRFYRYYLPLFPAAIERLDLRDYDLIISASYAVAKGVRTRPEQVHVCYIHTPMRYAWSKEDVYLQDHRLGGMRARMVRAVLHRLRAWDLRTNDAVDLFIANSGNVARRVEQFYGRTAEVLLPPVDTELFQLTESPREHYLSASRLVPYKRVDRVIEAFRMMPDKQLVITGDGPERDRLERTAPKNVRFLGHVDQRELVGSMQRAKALIAAADEDLGLTPLEAQACGTPSIALGQGGYLETVEDGVSGILFPDDRPKTIAAAVARFEAFPPSSSAAELRSGTMAYTSERFRERFTALVQQAIQQHGH